MLGSVLVVALSLVGASAGADEQAYTVAAGAGKVTVSAVGHWHVNKEYPWKLKCADTVLAKDKFTLAETTATVSGGKGECELKGGVCSGDKCKNFSEKVKL
jgi:hypothetical protein